MFNLKKKINEHSLLQQIWKCCWYIPSHKPEGGAKFGDRCDGGGISESARKSGYD
ncbi:hypothetical protein GCM10011498_30150 [Amylibacter cionae]|uniref:Uncharacterized protein n=1 Tax=Neptunicoccus cionae TaxID=2035344 RepID=A0A916R2Q2_9RHOB|nr:hypothetical protein GCM10011498_30150 [Amylibacter cionae]